MKRIFALAIQLVSSLYQQFYQYLKKDDSERVMLFRLVALFLWINLAAVFILAKVNPFHLLNPLKFLSLAPQDSRKEIILYFPASIKDLNEKSGSNEKSNIVELHQKAKIDDHYNSANREKLIVENAWGILQQLAVAPDSLRGVRAIKDELIVKRIWLFEGKLIVHLDSKKMNALGESQKDLMINCIRKSLQANLGAFSEVALVVQ
jgi:hypothetical protein